MLASDPIEHPQECAKHNSKDPGNHPGRYEEEKPAGGSLGARDRRGRKKSVGILIDANTCSIGLQNDATSSAVLQEAPTRTDV